MPALHQARGLPVHTAGRHAPCLIGGQPRSGGVRGAPAPRTLCPLDQAYRARGAAINLWVRGPCRSIEVLQDWFQRKEINAFALALAQDLGRRFPPSGETRRDKGARSQLASITGRLYAQALQFRQAKRLGVYGKAKLGNAFRWKLKEMGYSQKFVHEVTHGLVVHLAKGR